MEIPLGKKKEKISDEEKFLLVQQSQKASLRIRENRSHSLDLLVFYASAVDLFHEFNTIPISRLSILQPRSLGDENKESSTILRILTGLTDADLLQLAKDVKFNVEVDHAHFSYWDAIQTILVSASAMHSNSDIQREIDGILRPKSFDELETLKLEVEEKLKSKEPIDVEYWELLLKSISYFSSIALVDSVIIKTFEEYSRRLNERFDSLPAAARAQEIAQEKAEKKAAEAYQDLESDWEDLKDGTNILHDPARSPVPVEKYEKRDIDGLRIWNQDEFFKRLQTQRLNVLKNNFTPRSEYTIKIAEKSQPFETTYIDKRGKKRKNVYNTAKLNSMLRTAEISKSTRDELVASTHFDSSEDVDELYLHEMNKGLGPDEEIMDTTDQIVDESLVPSLKISSAQWLDKYKPRRPRYFNRIVTDYEWNRYNQVHYDAENPPPKIVRGYKFTIFYPDLLDMTKPPTYKTIKDPSALKDETVILVFTAGPPYEDLAFRIVNKSWDYGHYHGFKSSFENGVLYLWFQMRRERWVR